MSAVRHELAEALRGVRREQFEQFGERVLAWLAVAPAWPERVAERCDFLGDLRKSATELANAGLVQSTETLDDDGNEETQWWMPTPVRRDTIIGLKEAIGETRLADTARVVAHQMLAGPGDLPMPLRRWAELAVDPWNTHRQLQSRVRRAIAGGDTAEALAWIEAARVAADVIGGALVTATSLAERQIELEYRRAHDLKMLRSFLERHEQVRWIEDLLRAPNDRWALHLLGAGGMGKTMLIRHVMANIAPARGLVAVRIDFDHLSPDYPIRRPAQLIAALARELALHSYAQRQAFLFDRLDEALTAVDEVLSAELPKADPLANLRRPELEKVLHLFAEILQELPSPVLLILDTCEELAKVRVGDGGSTPLPPAVAASFDLLERLHNLVPSARVLFSGRRFLASRGNGWEATRGDGNASSDVHAFPERPYLALEELRGFDEGEADRLFREVNELKLTDAQREAVLARSKEVATRRVHRLDRENARERVRYQPFDLSQYAAWLKDDPTLDAARLAGASDPYIEQRIIGRIELSELRRAMPVVTMLRRFDKKLASVALALRDERATTVLRAIGEQEWVDTQPDDETETVFFEIQRALWTRLLAFYRSSAHRAHLDEARRRIAPAIESLVRGVAIAKLRFEYVDAALRALDPTSAIALWSFVEERAAREGALERLGSIAERLLADDGAAEQRTPLRAHVLATLAGITARLKPTTNIATQWKEVEALSELVSDAGASNWLQTRAIAGQIAAHRESPALVDARDLARLAQVLDRERPDPNDEVTFRGSVRDAALLNAIDVAIDALRVTGSLEPVLGSIVRWAGAFAASHAPLDLAAVARLWVVRALWLQGERDVAGSMFTRAIELGDAADALPATPLIESPIFGGIGVRARLEAASFRPFATIAFDLESAADEQDPDGDRGRLTAHTILAELANGAVRIGSERLAIGAALVLDSPDVAPDNPPRRLSDDLRALMPQPPWMQSRETDLAEPISEAARRVPPRFVGVAEHWASIGQPQRAMEVLERAIEAALKTGTGGRVIAIAERTKLRQLVFYRAQPGELAERLESSRSPEDRRLARVHAALYMGDATTLGALLADTPESASRQDPEHVEDALRALLVRAAPRSDQDSAWISTLPARYVATIALDVGRSVALVRPAQGAALLHEACTLFERCDDPVGAMMSATLWLAAEARARRDGARVREIWNEHVLPAAKTCENALDWATQRLWRPWYELIAAWRAWFDPSVVLFEEPRLFRGFPTEFPPATWRAAETNRPHVERPSAVLDSMPRDRHTPEHFVATAAADLVLRVAGESSRARMAVGARSGDLAKIDPDAPYDRLLNAVPAVLAAELAERDSKDGSMLVRVESGGLAGIAWEALAPRIASTRVGTGGAPRRVEHAAVLLASDRWTRDLTDPLEALPMLNVLRSEVRAERPRGAAFLVGTPLKTRGGLILQVEGSSRARPAERKYTPSTTTRGGSLLRPGANPLFSAPLVVLVAEPVESLAHGVAERTIASSLRELAHNTARHAQVVLTIPAMPSETTRAAIAIVAEWIMTIDVPDRARVTSLVHRLRTLIQSQRLDDRLSDRQSEIALDAIAYVGER